MASTTKTPARPGPLERGLAKQAALDELYARLSPENGGHRPLTADEIKIQKASQLTLAERDAVQADLYGRWVAVDDCHIDGVLAFAVGMRVPWTHVERYGWDEAGLVAPVDDPAAAQATAERIDSVASGADQAGATA